MNETTLRQKYAIAALSAAVIGYADPKHVADKAFAVADAMIAHEQNEKIAESHREENKVDDENDID